MDPQTAVLKGSVKASGTVVGSLQGVVELQGHIKTDATLSASVIAPMLIGLETYTGPYEVYPEVTEQHFETIDKRMADNLTVTAIPYHEVSNEHGETVIIGGRINGL